MSDIVTGIRAAMSYERTPYEVINLGNHRAVTMSELIAALEDALGVSAQMTRLPAQPSDVPQTFAHIEKARALLGYEPSTPLRDGLASIAAWLQER